jgi:hypothetical protein
MGRGLVLSRTVSKGRHNGHPWRVIEDGDRFRGQWLCALDLRRGFAAVCGAWYKSKANAEKGVKRRIEKRPVETIEGRITAENTFTKWRWPDYSTRRKRNPEHRCALPGPLEAGERKELPDSAFGLPRERKYPLFVLEGGKAVPSPSHASNAKARATQQWKAGKLSKTKRDQVHRRAQKVLDKCRATNPDDFAADWPTVKHAPVGLDGRDVAHFGKAIEMEAGGLRIQFVGRPAFYWEPRSKTLIVLQGAKRGRTRNPTDVDAKTADAFETFMGRNVQREHTASMPAMPHGVWRRAPGRAGRFDYWSDKFQGDKERTHPFSSGVRCYRGGGSQPPWIWLLRGGSLRVTRRGIEG